MAHDGLIERYRSVRRTTLDLTRTLAAEDHVIQSMPDASPTSWHLAHTAWFFETFVLLPAGEAPHHPRYGFLFNSYYNAVGERHARPRRGMLSRPTVDEVRRYRADVDARMIARIPQLSPDDPARAVIELGLHHEQQHQELLLTDIHHALSENPLRPVFCERTGPRDEGAQSEMRFQRFEGGVYGIGHNGEGFSFDNEGPRHEALVAPFAIADRLVTNAEYLAFMRDGGYERADLWLSDGLNAAREGRLRAPLYWEEREGTWHVFTLHGMEPVALHEPVCHVSYYEADAYARWAGARLSTEQEWEIAASRAPIRGNMLESSALHPRPAPHEGGVRQLFGDVWEWTASAYLPYPGYRPAPGALGEYNGKFMINQMVLRGGSCFTPGSHIRASYRNFFPPGARWQMSGVRLARDA